MSNLTEVSNTFNKGVKKYDIHTHTHTHTRTVVLINLHALCPLHKMQNVHNFNKINHVVIVNWWVFVKCEPKSSQQQNTTSVCVH